MIARKNVERGTFQMFVRHVFCGQSFSRTRWCVGDILCFYWGLLVGWPLGKLMVAPACVVFFPAAWTLLLSSLQPPHSDSPGAWQPPTLSSYQSPCSPSPHATSNLSPSHSLLSFTFTLINSFFPRTHIHLFFFLSTILSFTHPFLLCLPSISSPLSLAVWVFPVFRCAPFTHCAPSLSLW